VTDGNVRRQRATLRDVAAAAGVSMTTVSNVMNGRANRMSGATKIQIEKEIARLGYRPHSIGRSLRMAEWQAIGMLVVDDAPSFLAGGFLTNLIAGLSNRLSDAGQVLSLQGVRAGGFLHSPLIRDIRTDGICSFLSGDVAERRTIIRTLLRFGQPLIVFQETADFAATDVCIIREDDRAGGRLLAQEVCRAGAKRLAMLAPLSEWPGIAERVAGVNQFVQEKRRAGISLRIIKTRSMEFAQVQAALAADIAANGMPDAVLGGNDHMGVAALKYLTGVGIEVPRDILVTGFNGADFCQYTDPVLTSVHSPTYEMGERGAEEMIKRLRRGSFEHSTIVLPVQLERAGSTSR
jgi:LacI family transcriptional regulator